MSHKLVLLLAACFAMGFGVFACSDSTTGADAGISDAGSGIYDGGYATIAGSLAFTAKDARVWARHFGNDGGSSTGTSLVIAISSQSDPCIPLSESRAGPGQALALFPPADDAGHYADHGSFTARGDIGDEAYRIELNPDGGFPLEYNFLWGPFSIAHNGNIEDGVTGTFNLTATDGKLIQGSFGASYCGTY